MDVNEVVRHRMVENVTDQISRSHNSLGVKKVDRIYDRPKHQLVLMVSTREMLDRQVNSFLKGNKLIMEAVIQLDYDKPLHTKITGEDIFHDSEIDLSLIGFCEIKLKPGYHYTVMSCQLINPTLVKIILKSKMSFIDSHQFKIKKNKHRK